MKEQKKAKKVSWASGAKLCQLKYFKKADFPNKVGRQAPDHSKLETSRPYQVVSDGGAANVNFRIPQVQWRTPPQFVMRSNWRVAAGEESEEREVQNSREKGVLEALYPYCSSIPPNPFISLNVGGQLSDDANTPIISITPIEDTEEMDFSSSSTPSNISINSSLESLIQGLSTSSIPIIPSCKSVSIPEPSSTGISALARSLEYEVVIATVAAANAILKSKGLENLIDTDLLLLFLKNPELTQDLFNNHLLSSITNPGTSESNPFVHALQVPSSQLPIDKSSNKNSKPAKARSMIELSSSAHANNSGTASGPKPVQPSVSLLTSTIDFLIKSLIHERNQLNDAAMQIPEPLLGANAGKLTSSRPKQGIPSGTHTSNTCDLPTDKSTRSQSDINTGHLTVTKPMNQSPAADPNTGTYSQPKQVGLPVSLSFPASDLQSRKAINEHAQPEHFEAGAGAGSAQKTANPSISSLMSVGDLPSKKSTNEHNWQADTRNVGVPQPIPLPTSTHDFRAERPTSKQNQQVVTPPVITQSLFANTRTQKGFGVKPGMVPMSVPDFNRRKSLDTIADQVSENRPLSAPKINAEFWGTPPNFGSYPDANLVHVTRESHGISHFKKLIDEHGAHHGKGGREPVAGTNRMFPNPDMKLFNKEYGSPVPSPFAMFEPFSTLREHRLPPQFPPSPVSICPEMEFEPKFQKLCRYYNTRKGCRNGSSCRFLHDPSEQQQQRRPGGMLEIPKTKRMKADRSLAGW